MSTFVLIPGAGGVAWYWHRVVPLLEDAGHDAVAVDLPGDDESTGLREYTRLVLDAIGDRDDAVLVAQSLGAFTAPLVAARTQLTRLVLVNAMIPAPGETPGEWWGRTGSEPARVAAAERGGYSREFDLETYFLHDVPPEVAAAGESDRFFPVDFQRQLAHDRLGIEADVLPGGHLMALSQPAALADYLSYDTR